MSKITETCVYDRAWQIVRQTFKKGSACTDCEYLKYDGDGLNTLSYPWCEVLEDDEFGPFSCPAIDPKQDTLETLIAEAEENDDRMRDA